MLGWLVVTEKLVALPVVVQTTPPEPVKPGSVLHEPEALYVLLSTKYASWAVAALRPSAATRALKPRERYAENCGIAIAARMPMIATTTSNSINVKPLDRLRPAFCECMNPPLSGARLATPLHPSVHAPCRPKVQDSRGRRGGTFGACCPTSGDPPAQAPDSPHVSRRHPLRRAASIERLNTSRVLKNGSRPSWSGSRGAGGFVSSLLVSRPGNSQHDLGRSRGAWLRCSSSQ